MTTTTTLSINPTIFMVAPVTSSVPLSFVHLISTLPEDRKFELATKYNWNILLLSALSEETILGVPASRTPIVSSEFRFTSIFSTSTSASTVPRVLGLRFDLGGQHGHFPSYVLQTLLWDTPPEASLTCSLKDDARELEWFRAGTDEGLTDVNPGPDETTLAYQNPDKPPRRRGGRRLLFQGWQV
ncbi:hypothetical protein CVT25_008377 [Psilocybe cyanescens]|uniref:Uncharacterized protein n=1 Tax=Psilocybe cyanescens TaxID=93625 RepID=A0A409XVP2_PSICY|nr:hypothetical protein CVT25_008377 [Psilocybe cyanescens]